MATVSGNSADFRRLVLSFVLVVVAGFGGPSTAQSLLRVGVILPLTGPLASEAQEALAAIEDELRQARLPFVVHDDRGATDGTLRGVQQLVYEERVAVLIGPLSAGPAEILASKSDRRDAPVLSLASLSRDAALRLGKLNVSMVTFSSVPRAQLQALEQSGSVKAPRRLSVVSFSQAASMYADEVVASLGQVLPRQEAPLRVPLSRREDVMDFADVLQKTGVELVLGTVTEPIADELVTRFRRSGSKTAVIVLSPPRVSQRARVAARLVAAAAAKRASTPREIMQSIEGSPLYDKDLRNISLNWTVTEYRSSFSKMVVKTTDETRPCVCNSADGEVFRRCDCLRDEECQVEQGRDHCKVSCRRPAR